MGTGEMKILVTPVMAILNDAGEMAGGVAVLRGISEINILIPTKWGLLKKRVKAHKTKNGTKQILHNLRIQPPRAAKLKIYLKKPLDREAVIRARILEHEEEVYNYQRVAELRNRASAGYMNIQNDFTWSSRCIMVDWMVEVSQELILHTETLFLAVNYMDRFLSKIPVSRRQIQLVGAASLFLASKYEEIRSRRCNVYDLASMTDGYKEEQILCMERFILRVLKFNVTVPTTNLFCKDFVKSCDGDDKLKALSKFLCELTLIEMDTYLRYRPSITAAASLCLARYSLGLEPWTAGLVKKTGYEVGHFEDCLKDLRKTYLGAEAHQQQAVQEKYKQDKYHKVSDFNMNPVPNSDFNMNTVPNSDFNMNPVPNSDFNMNPVPNSDFNMNPVPNNLS